MSKYDPFEDDVKTITSFPIGAVVVTTKKIMSWENRKLAGRVVRYSRNSTKECLVVITTPDGEHKFHPANLQVIPE